MFGIYSYFRRKESPRVDRLTEKTKDLLRELYPKKSGEWDLNPIFEISQAYLDMISELENSGEEVLSARQYLYTHVGALDFSSHILAEISIKTADSNSESIKRLVEKFQLKEGENKLERDFREIMPYHIQRDSLFGLVRFLPSKSKPPRKEEYYNYVDLINEKFLKAKKYSWED